MNVDILKRATKDTLALIMAGGKGSRLKHLTEIRAKPAVYFGGKFRIIDFSLSNCVNSDIRKIGVLTQYRAHSLIRHLQKAWGFFRPEFGEFLELMPASQQYDDSMWYRGTADAISQNTFIISGYKPKYILILAGDHIYKQDYSIMLEQHIESGAKCTVGCVEVPVKEAHAFGVIGIDKNYKITDFIEKPSNPPTMPDNPTVSLASMGIYIFDADALMDALKKDIEDPNSTHDFGKDIIPSFVRKKLAYAHPFSKSCITSTPDAEIYWRDVGTIESYWQANIDLTYPLPSFDLYSKNWPLTTYQAMLPSAKFIYNDINQEKKRQGIALDTLVSGGCVISGGRVERSVLFSNVKINSYSEIHESILFPECTIGRSCIIKKAIIEKDCIIPEGTQIGVDPEKDAKQFYRTESGIVIVTPEMLT